MLEVQNLSIYIGTRCLIKSLSFTLNKEDKMAIIGEEGNGKSTLLKVLMQDFSYATVSGTINTHGYKIGYLKQGLTCDELKKSAFEYLFTTEENYFNKINEFYQNLKLFDLSDSILEQKMHTLSGGEKVKISLLKLLLEQNDLIFLDEPTNDLDIETLEWLETFIKKSKMPILFVSHDEVLLENTANKILHIEQLKRKQECFVTVSKTNYSDYIQRRMENIEKQNKIAHKEMHEYKEKEKKLARVLAKVEFDQRNVSSGDPHTARLLKKKMHSLKAQEKRLQKEEITEERQTEEAIFLEFPPVKLPTKKIILDFSLPELKNESRVLARFVELRVVGNEHIGIIGKNGVGKTTLLKCIYQSLRKRPDLKVGYMPQDYEEVFLVFSSLLEFLTESKDQEKNTLARKYLGNMNFTSEEMLADFSKISNGMKAKLFFLKFILQECNVLLLDEPTRNLSPLSTPIIRQVLKNYTGVIISVSHDRKYLEEVTPVLYRLTVHGLEKN